MLISRFENYDVENEISKVESHYSFVFPQQYKDFLLKYNGGFTPKTKFKANGISSDIKGFYGFGTVELSIKREFIEEWIPNKLFPIACDSFGNYILISIAGDKYGNIFFSDHEQGMKNSLVANDLSSFFCTCESDKIPDSAQRSIEKRRDALIAEGKGSVITPALVEMWQNEIDKYGNMIQEEVII
ncbi:MAG: SMI1/KNR4 family protein [Bacilli bacterium]|nr:SMI1/KNR4 family protein [Bacilli bacterium]